ncbi:recombinase family protein [Oscillospiraceae bacterium OttesenSCG-928-G22]|nr:recombinase family protein [Oscillospiraceae bacterium OttesenSCG-928-G22]
MEQQELRVAVYCRVASLDEYAIQRQKEKLLRFAQEQGIEGIAVYMDNGFGGLNFDREGFQQLEADIAVGRIRAVITSDISRIARNYCLASEWIEKVERTGVKLIFVNHPDNEVQSKIRQRLADEWRKDKKVSQKI